MFQTEFRGILITIDGQEYPCDNLVLEERTVEHERFGPTRETIRFRSGDLDFTVHGEAARNLLNALQSGARRFSIERRDMVGMRTRTRMNGIDVRDPHDINSYYQHIRGLSKQKRRPKQPDISAKIHVDMDTMTKRRLD